MVYGSDSDMEDCVSRASDPILDSDSEPDSHDESGSQEVLNADKISSDDEKALLDSKIILQDKTFRSLVHLLEHRLKGPKGVQCPDTLRYCIRVIDVLEEQFKEARGHKKKNPGRKAQHPQTKEDFEARIRGKTSDEEQKHPWMSPKNPESIPGMVMRAWDEMSEAQIKDHRSGFLSGGSDDRLDTYDNRKVAITRHSEWGQRKKTAFISCTSSFKEIVDERVPHFQKRQKNKKILDNTKLTLINTCARLAAGLPILKMKDELRHYKVTNRYGDPFKRESYGGNSFYEHEYLMPFSVGPQEIVGAWAWRDIEEWMMSNEESLRSWYHKVGIPAFKEHERVKLGGAPVVLKSGCDCCGQ